MIKSHGNAQLSRKYVHLCTAYYLLNAIKVFSPCVMQLSEKRVEFERALSELHSKSTSQDVKHQQEVEALSAQHMNSIEQLKRSVRQMDSDNQVCVYTTQYSCHLYGLVWLYVRWLRGKAEWVGYSSTTWHSAAALYDLRIVHWVECQQLAHSLS